MTSDSATTCGNIFKTPWKLGDASIADGREIRDGLFGSGEKRGVKKRAHHGCRLVPGRRLEFDKLSGSKGERRESR